MPKTMTETATDIAENIGEILLCTGNSSNSLYDQFEGQWNREPINACPLFPENPAFARLFPENPTYQ